MIGAKPTITSHRATPLVQANAGEILDSFSDFRCRRWHPANFRGRSVSSALPCMSFHERVEGAAGTFQRGKVSVLITAVRKRLSKASLQLRYTQSRKTSQRTASLDVLAEPNYYSKCIETSSTHVFASHLSKRFGRGRNARKFGGVRISISPFFATFANA
jgi:hypothetical protein